MEEKDLRFSFQIFIDNNGNYQVKTFKTPTDKDIEYITNYLKTLKENCQ